MTKQYRAYDTTTEWSGRARYTIRGAEKDAERHNNACHARGGIGAAIVAQRDGDRLADLDGNAIWPPHGCGTGAAEWAGSDPVLVAQHTAYGWSVSDGNSAIWWPRVEALKEIEASENPAAKAVEICSTSPMRGEWHS